MKIMSMKAKSIKKVFLFLLIYITLIFTALASSAFLTVPDSACFYGSENVSEYINSETSGNYFVTAKLFGKIPIKDVKVEVRPETSLIPCGDVFGVKFFTKGVIVIGTSDIETQSGFINPATSAGLEKNDIINKVNGKEVNTVEKLASIIEESNGKALEIVFTRDDIQKVCSVYPALCASDNKYKTGIWVRDSTAGIGTITYYNPENSTFAGLGHGICDMDTGNLMPLLRGTVVDVDISEIVKGKSGMPGELKGKFNSEKQGALYSNTNLGIYGILDKTPDLISGALPVAGRSEVENGNAIIFANPDGSGIKKYKVLLSKVDKHNNSTKSFVVEVTDPELLNLTGGIVQGMSGSPIVQNGKLVGAVTHVFVNDPTKGYGIFIENMLSEAGRIK